MYLGLDLGTSGLKAVLMDADGQVVADADAGYPNPHPQAGWSEQDPADWIIACENVLDQIAVKTPAALSDLRAIGFSGQMHGAVTIGVDGCVLRPAILWNDTRAAKQAAMLDATPHLRDITGNIVFPGFTAPKLLWMQIHEPDTFDAIHKVLLPKDYLRLWLTGDFASEMSDAAGTAWLDVGGRCWSDVALTAGHMRADQMPDLYEGSDVTGELRSALAMRWGIKGTVKIVGGGGDNAASACAAGCLSEGQGFVSLGTSGVLLAAKDGYAPDAASAVHTFCHAVPDRWYQMGVILAATDCLNWLVRVVGQDAGKLMGQMPERIEGPSDLLFLPYLSGERTPHNDANVRGSFIGLDINHSTRDLTQAVVEGVSFALADCLHALQGTGTQLDSLMALGGGTQSPFWCETLATVLDVALELPTGGAQGGAIGAARLALIGDTDAKPEDVMTRPRAGKTIAPRKDLHAAYADKWARFRTLYQAI